MRFYRRLLPFHAISFDLDDTLYSNQPIMLATEKKMLAYFADVLSDVQLTTRPASFNFHFWWQFRQQAITQRPELIHDVGLLRQQSYYLGARSLGLNAAAATLFADNALAYFVEQRSDFTLSAHTHNFLTYLKKQRPLVAITNGNVDTDKIGLSQYFDYHFLPRLNTNQSLILICLIKPVRR